jgi:hypothetical protein
MPFGKFQNRAPGHPESVRFSWIAIWMQEQHTLPILWYFCWVWVILSLSAITHLKVSTMWTRKLQLPSWTNWGTLDQCQEQFDMAQPSSVESTCINWRIFRVLVRFFNYWTICVYNQKMWLIALHWAQLQSGFHTPLLQDPTVPAPHLEGLYITSLR